MEGNCVNYSRKEKKHKLNRSAEQYLDSNVSTSEDGSFTKIKKKRKREKDQNVDREATITNGIDDGNNSSKNNTTHNLKIESSSDVDSRKKKKRKTESGIEHNDEHDNNYASDFSGNNYKKKKKKKHREVETSESSFNGNMDDGVIGTDRKKAQAENEVKTCVIKDHIDQDPSISYELDTLSVKDKKKKKRRNKNDKLSVCSNENIIDNDVENQLQYTNSQSIDNDYLTDNIDICNSKKKKKKKHKEVKIENAIFDELSESKTESQVKVKAKSKVTNSNTKVENKTHQESSIHLLPESHAAKAKKKHKHAEYNGVNYQSNDSSSTIDKLKEKETEDDSNIGDENRKKKRKNKHKKNIENGVTETDSLIEENNCIKKTDDLESSQKTKNKKKKSKKYDSVEIDALEEAMDTETTEFVEPQQKKKKKKKHLKKSLEEESELVHQDADYTSSNQVNMEENHVAGHNSKEKHKKNLEESKPVHIDSNHKASDQESTKEDHFDSHSYKKKKKKRKRQKESIQTEDETDCDSPKTRYKKMEMILQEGSPVKDKADKQPEESSGFESDEGDYSESERVPRISKEKPSIFTKYPKLARIMQDSDSDDNYPHLQHRKLTLAEALKLSELEIKLRHEPPPQHCVEKYPGTCTLTLEERKQFSQYSELKKGRFNYDEDQRIVHNWKKFCKTHEWKRSIIYPFLHRNKKGFFYVASVEGRKKFVQFLAKGLLNRSLYSVYTRFRNLYATHKRNRYKPEEDEIIMRELKGDDGRNRYATVARKLNRTRASVWRRYKLLILKQNENSDNEDEKKQKSIDK